MIERINSSYFIKNLYNLFALSYERLLQKDDSTFSDLDTLLSAFVEEFKNIQTEEFEKIISKSKCEEITATKITLIIESDEDSEPDFLDIFAEEMLLDFSIKTKTNIKSVAMEDL